jgi:hypothetical protein
LNRDFYHHGWALLSAAPGNESVHSNSAAWWSLLWQTQMIYNKTKRYTKHMRHLVPLTA